ncbi:hypothetical protein RRG08_023290 [Elysia crispata]|uniref:Uncharacterized protein n=1 Tax=Elysia crispata TaxID=231223 RepID=A0AAE1BCE0_9GAST|nr:hypothetical protein RRG08_023290 [Elysia crispata]
MPSWLWAKSKITRAASTATLIVHCDERIEILSRRHGTNSLQNTALYSMLQLQTYTLDVNTGVGLFSPNATPSCFVAMGLKT